jgi:hypothetical protein
MPRILSLTPIDYQAWHAGHITVRPPGPLDCAEDEEIEESELHFEVVKWVTGYGDRNEPGGAEAGGWPSGSTMAGASGGVGWTGPTAGWRRS